MCILTYTTTIFNDRFCIVALIYHLFDMHILLGVPKRIPYTQFRLSRNWPAGNIEVNMMGLFDVLIYHMSSRIYINKFIGTKMIRLEVY